jgi:hypothetical protein
MELEYFTFETIKEYNDFVISEKKNGKIVMPVSVLRNKFSEVYTFPITVFFYYINKI